MKRGIPPGYKIMPGQEGFLYPKVIRDPAYDENKLAVPESTVQGTMDFVLAARGVYYIRIPDIVYIAIKSNPTITGNQKAQALRAVAGLPDNQLQEGITNKFFLGCNADNKSSRGKLRGKQVPRSRQVPYVTPKSPDQVNALVDEFQEMAQNLKSMQL